MQYEVINLGTKQNPHNVNLGTRCSPSERETFIKLFKEYKDIFTWTYDDFKTYDTKIIQHVIPLHKGTKTLQQKLRKMHPTLSHLAEKELNKLVVAKIIFPICHSHWVANLVPTRKNNGAIRLCIYFLNFNRASEEEKKTTTIFLLCTIFFNVYLAPKCYLYLTDSPNIIRFWPHNLIYWKLHLEPSGEHMLIEKCRLV